MTIYAAHNKRGRQGAAAGCALYALRGRAAANFCKAKVDLHSHLCGAQQARSAPRTNVKELFCGSKITRNDSDEAERRERSPPGVVSVANVEGLAAAGGQVRPARAAREWKCFASQREFRGERGGPEGDWPSGAIRIRRNAQFVAGNDTERQMKLMYYYMSMCDWKAEMNLRTPKLTSDGIGPDR